MDGTVIDNHAAVEGKLLGKDAHVHGRFKGEVEVTGRLTLGEGAKVDANVKADVVEIGGEFKGKLVARSLVLLEKGRVEGTVDAHTLTVREGAVLNAVVNAGRPVGKAASGTAAP